MVVSEYLNLVKWLIVWTNPENEWMLIPTQKNPN